MAIIFDLFNRGGLVAVLIFVGLEYTCFPIPSEVILPFVGSLAAVNGCSVIGVILLSVIFSYIGCLVCYLIGYYGGAYLYNKIYERFKGWQKGLDLANSKFIKYGSVSVLLCRLIPLCRTYISFFAGMFKQSLLKYSFYSVLGIFVWNTCLILLGFVLVDKWVIIGEYYNKYKIILIILISFIMFSFLFCKLYKRGKKDKTINGD